MDRNVFRVDAVEAHVQRTLILIICLELLKIDPQPNITPQGC